MAYRKGIVPYESTIPDNLYQDHNFMNYVAAWIAIIDDHMDNCLCEIPNFEGDYWKGRPGLVWTIIMTLEETP